MCRSPSSLFRFFQLAALCALSFSPLSATSLTTSLTTEERRNFQRETLVLIEFLQGYHYSDRPFYEVNAGELIERYFDTLDPERLFFLKGDTDFLRRRFERNLKTVYLFKGDLHPAFEIYDLFAKRVVARCAWIETRLDRSFPFDTDAQLDPDRDAQDRPADARTADSLWEKILQNELINERVRGRDAAAAVAEVRRRYAEKRKRAESADPLRVREFFLNALMGLFDPHCGYFSKETADVVSGDLTGAVTGIGVDLRQAEGNFIVKSLQPGGPAELNGGIHEGDEFLSVGEAGDPGEGGGTGEQKTLAGLRLREVVERVRGKPGTKLALTVRSAVDGAVRTVELERSRMEIADNHASGRLYQVSGDGGPCAVGFIDLPGFYGDSEDGATTASMTKDVEELLAKFTAKGAEAVVIDIRENGGGLVNEAVSLTGLFIEKGPALLTRGKSGKPTILRDENPSIAFAGPVVVLTSRHSASASEGFSGAMQAYRRGLIVGGETTFGKGTMQWFVDLGKTFTSLPEQVRAQWGVARVTREFFYLPDGNSPQFDGVRSDVVLPVFTPPGDVKERDLPHALPPTKIPAPEPLDITSTQVARVTPELREQLRAKTAARVATLPEFALDAEADKLRAQWWKTGPLSLRLSARQAEHDSLNRQRIELRRKRRELDASHAFPSERIDLDVVTESRRAHQTSLLAQRTSDGAPLANRLSHETFYYRADEAAMLRPLALEKFDWDVARDAAPQLAQTWAEAANIPADDALTEAIRMAFTTLALRDDDAAKPVPAVTIFRENLGGTLDEKTFQTALGALLKKAAEIDVDVLRDQRPLDVELRESLRLAVDWVRARGAEKTGAPAGETSKTADAGSPASGEPAAAH
jgi:carboxyl-terminal processing protease